ncbi:MAG: hypothetical protein ACYCZY_11610 [Lacisediminihabitans sp.]
MPEPEMTSSPAANSEFDDREQLVARIAAAEDRTLDYWMSAVISSAAGSTTVKALQQTLSWRITRPLRAVRIVYGRVSQVGVRKTIAMVRVRLAQLRQAKKRG